MVTPDRETGAPVITDHKIEASRPRRLRFNVVLFDIEWRTPVILTQDI